MNPDDKPSPPLTFDETVRLASFLAERGQPEALYSVLSRVATEVAVAVVEEASR